MPPPKRAFLDPPSKQDVQQGCNRVHARVVIRDVDKGIYHTSSPRAILSKFLGGIKGHESLLNAMTLHREVSIGNVLLNGPEDDGFLIDLDLAVKVDGEQASGAPSKTGAKGVMAIGALHSDEHTFMHELESFFWVLLWLGVHWNGAGQDMSKPEYESWTYKEPVELAEIKTGKVARDDWFNNEVNGHVTGYCKILISCIQELRKVGFLDGKVRLRIDNCILR